MLTTLAFPSYGLLVCRHVRRPCVLLHPLLRLFCRHEHRRRKTASRRVPDLLARGTRDVHHVADGASASCVDYKMTFCLFACPVLFCRLDLLTKDH